MDPNCYEFGTDEYCQIGTSTGLQIQDSSFTFMMWVCIGRFDNNHGDNCIIGQDNCRENSCLHLVIRYGKPYFGFYCSDTEGRTILQRNTWYHLAFSYDYSQGIQSIFVNGKLDASSGGHPPIRNNGYPVNISRYANGRWLNGKIAGVRLILSALDCDEVESIMFDNMGLSPIEEFNPENDLKPVRVGEIEYPERILHFICRNVKFDESLYEITPIDYILK